MLRIKRDMDRQMVLKIKYVLEDTMFECIMKAFIVQYSYSEGARRGAITYIDKILIPYMRGAHKEVGMRYDDNNAHVNESDMLE